MASIERLTFLRPEESERPRILIVDGFGQRANDPVTHEVAAALAEAFPQAEVPRPLATAETVGEDTTVQLSFADQTEKVYAELDGLKSPTYVYGYSQGGVAVASALAHKNFPHIKSVTFVGTPINTEREQERITRLNTADMGGVFEYVATQMTGRLARKALAGAVSFHPRQGNPRYVGLTEEYLNSFPSKSTHISNLGHVANTYPTTIVSLGGEEVTDCTPENARTLGKSIKMPITDRIEALDWELPRQGVVIKGAPHRLGKEHRTVTIPRIMRLRTRLGADALMYAL